MPEQTPESRVPTQILMQRRAVQAAFPKVDAAIKTQPVTANPCNCKSIQNRIKCDFLFYST
jgi:hypothetical protein